METLQNWGIKFLLATMKELQLETLYVLPFVYTPWCSRKCISDCVDSQSCVKEIRKWETCPILKEDRPLVPD
jgi:hypothetical protein